MDLLDELGISDGEQMELNQTAAPTPRRRGRPRKEEVPALASIKPTVGTRAPKAEVPMPKAGAIAEGITGLYQFAAIPMMGVRPQTAMALMANADDIGKAWEAAAVANPAIRKALLSLMGTSTIGIVVVAHMPVIMTFMNESRDIKDAAAAKDALGERSAHSPGAPASPTYTLEPVPAVI